jgi:hypothetical protein
MWYINANQCYIQVGHILAGDFFMSHWLWQKSMGVVGSRWAPRSSKPVAGRVAGCGGFDSHPLPPS